MKNGAGAFLRINPELAAILLDQRATDGESHAYATGFGGKERLKQLLEILFFYTRPTVLYRHLGYAFVCY